jgi:zinc transport system ATP-binding protein
LERNDCKHCCTKVDKLTVKIEDNTILDEISMHMHCNETTMLVGKNGAGKSTLVRAILNEVPYEGSISFSSKHNNSTKLTIGYVPQKIEIEASPMSVYDFIASVTGHGPVCFYKSKKQYVKILEHLKEFGAEKLIDKRMCDLSGGQVQRVLIAAATMPYPELLIMDEPVSGIDASGKQDFYKLINEIKNTKDIAILIISHDFEYVRQYADKVVLINKKVLKSGTPEQVLTSSEFKNEFGMEVV